MRRCTGVEKLGTPFTVSSLPFIHVCCMLHATNERVTAARLAQWFGQLRETTMQTSDSWNLVMTREWMMMVPRSVERTGSVALKYEAPRVPEWPIGNPSLARLAFNSDYVSMEGFQ